MELIIFIIFIILYFTPTIVAVYRNHRQKVAIGALNFFLGITAVGWVWALVWSLTNPDVPRDRD